jgi:uncharacterized protein
MPSVLAAQAASQPVLDTFDCDCACASDPPPGAERLLGRGQYVRADGLVSVALPEGWQTSFNPHGPVGIAVLNTPAQRVLAAFDRPLEPHLGVERVTGVPRRAAAEAVRTLVHIGLLRRVDGSPVAADRPSTLSAWLHVTEACNLDCPYCYVRKQPSMMSAELGRAAVDRLLEIAVQHGYTTLKLKYAGGEPTLNLAVIQAMHAHAARCAAGAGLVLEEVILSNGVGVADAVLDFLAGAGMRLMVSLDGGPDTHDRVRARRDGQSTYAAVVDTVERALARGLRPNISITLTALNLDGIEGAVAFALERELPFNLNFYRECSPAGPGGAHHDGDAPSPLVPEPERLVATMLRILGLIQTFPTYPWPLTGVLDRTRLDVPHSHPCSAGRDYLVVGTDGRLSACQMLLDEPWSDLSAEDPLGAIRRCGEELFLPVEAHPDCNECQWRTACSGGCPLLRKSALHGHYCAVYRRLLPEVVHLEGKRLLACQP